MLYLVEGLNCAGKSTWIKVTVESGGMALDTPWMNPLRNSIDTMCYNPVLLSMYETVVKTMYSLELFRNYSIYWDRTWLSAYVYGSLSKRMYNRIVDMYAEIECISILFMDTPVDVCYERFLERQKTDPRNYVKVDKNYWKEVYQKFLLEIDKLSNRFIIRTIEGV